MSLLRTWIFSIFAAAIVLSILNDITPKGAVRNLERCMGTLAMMAVFLSPLIGTHWDDFHWDTHDMTSQINEMIARYEETNAEELKSIIVEKTAAYILDKAKSLGREGEVTVITKERDGVPYPEEVELTMPYDAELSRYITTELGIDAEHQFWRENAYG